MKSKQRAPAPKAAGSGAPQGRATAGGRGNAYHAERLKERGASNAEKTPMPTAGPSEDDRGVVNMPDKVLQGDLKARILWLSVVDSTGALEVKIGAGLQQGLFDGMNLTILTSKGRALADVSVWDVQDRLCRAVIAPAVGRVTPDQVSGEGSNIILRPTA